MRTILRHESASEESVLKLWFLLLILESGRFMMANMPMPLRDSHPIEIMREVSTFKRDSRSG